MTDEQRLRELLAGEPVPGAISARAVIRKSRARRLPRRLAAGGIGMLAVAGIAVLGIPPLLSPPQSAVMMEQDDHSAASGPAEGSARGSAYQFNSCQAPVAWATDDGSGLQLEVEFPSAVPAGGGQVTGLVRLVNTGAEQVTGSTSMAPAIAVLEDGIVQWHSQEPVDAAATAVDLAPGQSLEYQASFLPVRCAAGDDADGSLPPGLPPLAPGSYQLQAAIDFVPMSEEPQQPQVVSGPPSSIVLR